MFYLNHQTLQRLPLSTSRFLFVTLRDQKNQENDNKQS